MQTVVALKLVPDTVEELTVAPDERSLETEFLRFKPSDPDEHALEQALGLKEQHGGTVTAVALDAPEVDDVLFTALAKGVDRAVKLCGDCTHVQSFAAAEMLASFLQPDQQQLSNDTLILLRSQAIDDLEGEIGPFLASRLGLPYVGVVTGVSVQNRALIVTKEFAGGLRGEFAVALPAVLGIQSAERPPRYVPIAKVRAAMKSGRIETIEMALPASRARTEMARLYKPTVAGRATMLDGAPEVVAAQIVQLLANRNLI
jgi:electron transfer flavoprotein beta subunit